MGKYKKHKKHSHTYAALGERSERMRANTERLGRQNCALMGGIK